MKALAVSHNGQKVAVVGAMLNSCVMAEVTGMTMAELQQPDATFHLFVVRTKTSDERYRPDIWRRLNLSVGDEITIRVVDVESDDRSMKHVPQSPKRPARSKNRGDDSDFDSRFGRLK